jgi:hypothetical protein
MRSKHEQNNHVVESERDRDIQHDVALETNTQFAKKKNLALND